jgi:hypothetical protein
MFSSTTFFNISSLDKPEFISPIVSFVSLNQNKVDTIPALYCIKITPTIHIIILSFV